MATPIHVTPDGDFESGKAEPLFRLTGTGK